MHSELNKQFEEYIRQSVVKYFNSLPFVTAITINMEDIARFGQVSRKYLRKANCSKDYVMFFYYGWFICAVDFKNSSNIDMSLVYKKTKSLICNRLSLLPKLYLQDTKISTLFYRDNYV